MEQKTRLRFFRSGDVAGLEEELNTRSAEGWQALRPGRFFQHYARGEGVFVHRIGGCLARRGSAEDITASATGLTIVAFVAVAFCVLGAVILSLYNEKKVMKTITACGSRTRLW